MKIKERHLLAGLTAAFVLFTAGLFLGRNLIRPAVVTARIAPTVETMPSSLPAQLETTGVPEPEYPLDINSAAAEELDFLPGIGPVIAQRIVEWRESNGPYRDVTELLNVEGIGPSRLEEILPYITIGG